MHPRSQIVLDSVLRVMRPLVRLLMRHGITYPAFAAALKRVFLDAAHAELAATRMPATDSALTLLSGVHRRDVRSLTRGPREAEDPADGSFGLATQVVARWLHDPAFRGPEGQALALPRSSTEGPSFDALVSGLSRDVRPRAVLDELKRLGVVAEDEHGVTLLTASFTPRKGLKEMAWLFADNLGDHIAAASANLQGERSFLEQSVFVDSITEASAARLHKVSVQAWKQAFQSVMGAAQERFDADQDSAEPEARTHRARFGVYFYSDKEQS